jgi:cation:H+ antiporter
VLFVVGVIVVIWGTERFVEGMLGSTIILGVSTFALGVVFGGFDAENLGTGVVAGIEGLPGVSLGTVIGSSIFLMCVALGICGLLVPLEVNIPPKYIYMTLLSPIPLFILMRDGTLSRTDGLVLLLIFIPLIWYITTASKKETFLKKEEVVEIAEEREKKPRWFFPALMIFGLVAIGVGAELIARGAKGIIVDFGISDTFLGMIFVAAAVSFEEIAREIIPAYRGHPEISIGNIMGTILFFVCFNVGIIALISPLRVDPQVVSFHWPFMMGVLILTGIFLLRKRVGRVEGMILLTCYGTYLLINLSLIK